MNADFINRMNAILGKTRSDSNLTRRMPTQPSNNMSLAQLLYLKAMANKPSNMDAPLGNSYRPDEYYGPMNDSNMPTFTPTQRPVVRQRPQVTQPVQQQSMPITEGQNTNIDDDLRQRALAWALAQQQQG